MEPFPDLSQLADEALAARLVALEQEEGSISLRRRTLHGRIDLLRKELVDRVKTSLTDEGGGLELPSDPSLGRGLFEGTGDLPAEHDLGPMPDVGQFSTDDLRSAIRALEREEDDVSLRRRVIHGQLDILRAERYRRGRGEHVVPADLASILSHHDPSGDEAA